MLTKINLSTPLLATALLLAISGCGGGGTSTSQPPTPPTPPPPPAIHNEWSWQGGSTSVNQLPNYGTLGMAVPANTPGGRYGALSWTDSAGNFWLFGGLDYESSGVDPNYLNDVWKYSNGQWTWMGGSSSPKAAGVYGTLGVPAAGNTPGARNGAASWKDSSGALWLFGGEGEDSTGLHSGGFLNDLWKYSSGEWTWMGGPSDEDSSGLYGIYGTLGIPSATNLPGPRTYPVSWTDTSGNLWLFGGVGFDSKGAQGILSDLWKYDGGQWAWMAGSSLVNDAGSYGAAGDPNNRPGARYQSSGWIDADGSLWLFGGTIPGSENFINDLWKYSKGQWTFVGGSNQPNIKGIYGTQGAADAKNQPGSRSVPITWIDTAGDFWLFGGFGVDSAGKVGDLDDLWKYHNGEWSWVSGSDQADPTETYGTQGVPAQSNSPGGGRGLAASWVDSSGNFWLYGGVKQPEDYLGDLWKYQP